jgi:hypothetical protein
LKCNLILKVERVRSPMPLEFLHGVVVLLDVSGSFSLSW